MKFKEWFEEKLVVGRFPTFENIEADFEDIDIIINVSDEYYPKYVRQIIMLGKQYFWFPMNECKRDIGLNSIYAAMNVLFHAENGEAKVYLHCHAGANRSPSIAQAYHYMRTGEHLKTDRLSYGVGENGYINQLIASCHRGYLPPKSELEKFLNATKETLLEKRIEASTTLTGRVMGGSLDRIKLNSITNF